MSLATRIAQEFNTVRNEVGTIDNNFSNVLNSALPYSGYTHYASKADNFYFEESSSFLYSLADKNRYVKFLDRVVDTYGEELITDSWNNANATHTIDNDEIEIVYAGSGTITISQTIPTEIGKRYVFKGNIKKGTATDKVKPIVYSNTYSPIANASADAFIDSYAYIPFEVGFTAVSNPTRIAINSLALTSAGTTYLASNLSVKEIQTANFQAHIPNVEVQDRATYGLTMQTAKNKHDYVVVDREDIKDLTIADGNTTFSIDGDTMTGNGTQTYKNVKLCQAVQGRKYAVNYTVNSYTSGTLSRWDGGWITDAYETTLGTHTTVVTLENSSAILMGTSTPSFVGEVTINSVKQVDEIYKAKRDTADMYDYEYIAGDDAMAWEVGTIVKMTGFSTIDDGTFMLRTVTNHGGATLGVNYDFSAYSTYWINLGTAENMKLSNPYFEVVDYISNQVLAYHAYSTLTQTYEGILTETLTVDVEDTATTREVMTLNGFSVVSKGVYAKGVYLCVPLGYWQTLNDGAMSPFVNNLGTRSVFNQTDTGSGAWYLSTAIQIENIAQCFNIGVLGTDSVAVNGTGGVANNSSSNVEDKYYNIVYKDQFIDLREYAFKADKITLDRMVRDGEFEGVEGTLGHIYSDFVTISGFSSELNRTYSDYALQLTSGTIPSYSFFGSAGNNKDYTYKAEILSEQKVWLEVTGVANSGTDLIYINNSFSNKGTHFISGNSYCLRVSKVHKINSQGTSLTIDLIGSPENYPDIMKERLAEGKSIVGVNPLLVDDLGNSLIPDGTSKDYKFRKKVISTVSRVESDNNGETYSGAVFTPSYISNSQTGTPPSTRIRFDNYTSQNKPLLQSTPLAVETVEDKVYFSNSHSIHKGGIYTLCLDKVATADVSRDFESKYLENVKAFDEYDEIVFSVGQAINLQPNRRYLVLSNSFLDANYGDIVKYIGTSSNSTFTTISTNFAYISTINWEYVDSILIPEHSALSLTDDTSIASKYFKTIAIDEHGELHEQVFIQEIVPNGGVYDGDDDSFTQLTNGTITDLNANTALTKCVSRPLGVYL